MEIESKFHEKKAMAGKLSWHTNILRVFQALLVSGLMKGVFAGTCQRSFVPNIFSESTSARRMLLPKTADLAIGAISKNLASGTSIAIIFWIAAVLAGLKWWMNHSGVTLWNDSTVRNLHSSQTAGHFTKMTSGWLNKRRILYCSDLLQQDTFGSFGPKTGTNFEARLSSVQRISDLLQPNCNSLSEEDAL